MPKLCVKDILRKIERERLAAFRGKPLCYVAYQRQYGYAHGEDESVRVCDCELLKVFGDRRKAQRFIKEKKDAFVRVEEYVP